MPELEGAQEHEVTWLEDAGEPAMQQSVLSPTERVAQLEAELDAKRREVADVRKELAAKTVQLMRREQQPVADKPSSISAGGAAPAPTTELERHMHQLAGQVHQLQQLLAQREEELEEARRLAATQKRALREAAAQQGEREAADHAAEEANKALAGAAVEEELERLTAELAAARTRNELELQAREAEVRQLKMQLDTINTRHKEALSATEAALTEAWTAEINRQQVVMRERLDEYEAEVARLRTQLEHTRSHADSSTLISELAMLNNQKVQVQREFEAFKEMATQTARKNREEVARLLEENATLHSRLASYKTAELLGSNIMSRNHTGGSVGGVAVLGHITGVGARSKSAGTDALMEHPPPGASSSSAYAYLETYMPQLLARLDRHRRGLVPMVVIGGVLVLMILIAIVRAAASTHSQHGSPLCFLAKLGIRIGSGCGPAVTVSKEPQQDLAQLLDRPARIHDVDLSGTTLPAGAPRVDGARIPRLPEALGKADGSSGTAQAVGSAQPSGALASSQGQIDAAAIAEKGKRWRPKVEPGAATQARRSHRESGQQSSTAAPAGVTKASMATAVQPAGVSRRKLLLT